MRNKLIFLTGIIFICYSIFLYAQKVSSTPLVIETSAQELEKSHFPKLIIEDIGVSANIFPATYTNGEWQPDARGVSKNDNVIYGHNWKSILGNLIYIKPGTEIKVLEDTNTTVSYIVKFTQEIDPNVTTLTNVNDVNKLVIYTCSGVFDSKRFIVVAEKV